MDPDLFHLSHAPELGRSLAIARVYETEVASRWNCLVHYAIVAGGRINPLEEQHLPSLS